MTQAQRELLALLRVALTGEGRGVASEDWQAVLEAARFAHVASAAAVGLMGCDCWRRLPGGVQEAFRAAWEASVAVQTRQSEAYARIGEALARAGVPYCPLKGLTLRALYPAPEMRDMVDIDLLIPTARRADARRAMEAEGFAFEGEAGVHDCYTAAGELEVELHSALLSRKSDHSDSLDDPWSALTPCPDAPLRFLLPTAMEYQYLILHMEKHLSQAGLGLRDVMDVFLYRRAHAAELDESYAALARVGLLTLTRNLERLAEAWFAGGPSDGDLATMGDFVFASGVHGTEQQSVLQLMPKSQAAGRKGRYVLSRLFPGARAMSVEYPSLRRAPWLLPACWVRQWGKQLRALRGETAKQWRLLQSVDDASLARHHAGIAALYGTSRESQPSDFP